MSEGEEWELEVLEECQEEIHDREEWTDAVEERKEVQEM